MMLIESFTQLPLENALRCLSIKEICCTRDAADCKTNHFIDHFIHRNVIVFIYFEYSYFYCRFSRAKYGMLSKCTHIHEPHYR